MNTNKAPTKADLIVKHAVILTMDHNHTVIEDGAIVISGSEITAIGTTASIGQNFVAEQIIDAQDCIIIPGLINAHTHIPMSFFKGLADDLPLESWLNDFIWPLEKKLVNSNFVFDSTLHGAAEMLKNGVTLANDMYFEGDAMAKALTIAGARCIIGDPVIGDRVKEKDGVKIIGQDAIANKIKYKDNPLVDFSLAPHAIYSNSKPILEKCAEVALENDLLVHIHISEADWEKPDCIEKYGKKPVEFLRDIGLLKSKIVLAHGIWIEEDEMDILAEHNASIAICTESNLKLANGFAPLKQYLQHKVRCCFATDGVASNNNLDLLSELDFNAKLHKNLNHDPTFLPAEQMLSMATIEAAKVLYKDKELGSLEVGKKADLVILDCNAIEAQPMFNPYSQVIYSLGGRAVRDVIINGRIVLKNKKLTTLDETELIATAKKYKALILNQQKP